MVIKAACLFFYCYHGLIICSTSGWLYDAAREDQIKTDCNIPLVISPQEIRFEAKLYQLKEVT